MSRKCNEVHLVEACYEKKKCEYVQIDTPSSAWKEGDWLDKNFQSCVETIRGKDWKNICIGIISRFKIKKEYKHNFGIICATHQ